MQIYSSQLWNQTTEVRSRYSSSGRVLYGKKNQLSNKVLLICHYLPLFDHLLKYY